MQPDFLGWPKSWESGSVTTQHTHTCPVAGVLNLFGDNWTWLIIREAFYGATRFKDFQRNTGIARNILSSRLSRLVEEGILAKADIGAQGTRFAYTLTPRGQSLQPLLLAMTQWGNAQLYGPGREPVLVLDRATGEPLLPIVPRRADGTPVPPEDIVVAAGPGASPATRRRLEEASNPLEPATIDAAG
jgi:DNA-binding HxlR family transcriptional regulator